MSTERNSMFGLREWVDGISYISRGSRGRFLLCLVSGLLLNGFVSAANPLALKYLFDEGIIQGDFRRFALISFALVALFTLWRVGLFWQRMYVLRLKASLSSALSLRMLSSFYERPYTEVIKHDRGYFLSRIYDEVITTALLVVDNTLSLANSAITLLVAIGVTIAISPHATLSVFLVVPVLYFLSQKYGGKIREESLTETEEEAKTREVLGRAVGSYKVTRIFALESSTLEKVGERIHRYMAALVARFRTSARYELMSGIFTSHIESLVIVGAGYQMLIGRMSFGGFMGFMNAFWAVVGGVRSIVGLIPEMSRASGLVKRLKDFEQPQDGSRNVQYSDCVRLDRVVFSYGGQNILSDMNLAPRRGERLLVVGPNGSGKSTLAHLLSGLLQPTSGVATTFPLERISVIVPPYEFAPGTVRDHLFFAGADKTERVEALVRTLGLGDSLDRDPAELSAGQRKRLEILLVLLKDADLYILDEPLAGIDVGSRAGIIQDILESTRGRILVAIMHGDAEFFGHFDRILELGRIEGAVMSEHKPGTIASKSLLLRDS